MRFHAAPGITPTIQSVLIAVCMFGTAVSAEAAPILADFRAELWFSYTFPDKGPLVVLEALLEPVPGRPDLTGADAIVNTGIGHVNMDLTPTGKITLTGYDKVTQGTGIADYQLAVFTISNIAFKAGRSITGVTALNWAGMFDVETGLHPKPTLDFKANSVTITYDVATIDEDCTDPQADPFDCFWFTLKDGGTSTFQLELSPPVPEPAAMTLLGLGLAGLGARKWRQRRSS